MTCDNGGDFKNSHVLNCLATVTRRYTLILHIVNFPPVGVQSCGGGVVGGFSAITHHYFPFSGLELCLCTFGYLLNNDTREGAPWAELVTGFWETIETFIRHYTYLEPVSSDHKDVPRGFVYVTGTPTH